MRAGLVAVTIFLAGGGLLQGCDGGAIGQGPIELSPAVQAAYDKYLHAGEPGAFVIGERGTYYSYCQSTGCRPGDVQVAMRLCRSEGDEDCRIYDVGGRVVWRQDLPAPAGVRTAAARDTSVSAAVQTERDRNAAKVDCTRKLQGSLSAELRTELAADLAVKESRGPWTFCDLFVEGVASGKVSKQALAALRAGPVDAAMLRRLVDLVRPSGGRPKVAAG